MKKQELIEKLYIIIWAFYTIEFVLLSSSSLSQYSFAGRLHGIFSMLTLVMMILFTLFVNRYPRRKILSAIAYMVLIFCIAISTKGINILIGMLFSFTAQKIDVKKLIKFDIKLKLILLFIVVVLCGLGIIENKVGYANNVYKQSLGFINQNVFTAFSSVILIEWLYEYCGQVKRFQYIIILILVAIVSNISKGRTSLYTFIFIFVLHYIANFKAQFFYTYISKFSFAVVTPVLAFLSFLGCNLYMQENAFVIGINRIMSNRLHYASYALSKYGVKLIGFKIEEQGLPVDMGYVYCVIRFGLIYLVIICLIYSVQFIKFLNHKRIDIALLMLFFVLVSMGEGYTYNIVYNTAMLYFFHTNKRIRHIS